VAVEGALAPEQVRLLKKQPNLIEIPAEIVMRLVNRWSPNQSLIPVVEEEAPEALEAIPTAEEGEEVEQVPAVEVEPVTPAEVGEELPATLDELFTLKPEVFDINMLEIEEDEEGEEGDRKKKKKKKKKFVEMEYDPDKDVVIVKRKRKRGAGGWEDDWNL
jgi:N utilization substance protein A